MSKPFIELNGKSYEVPTLFDNEIHVIEGIKRTVYDDAYTSVRHIFEAIIEANQPKEPFSFVPSGKEVTRGLCQCGCGHQFSKHLKVDGIACDCGVTDRHNHCHNCGSLTETTNLGVLYYA
jgi:hypothetical protein